VKGVVIIFAGHKRPLLLLFAATLRFAVMVTQEILSVESLLLSLMFPEAFVGT
jgi:hypothetical protein